MFQKALGVEALHKQTRMQCAARIKRVKLGAYAKVRHIILIQLTEQLACAPGDMAIPDSEVLWHLLC